MKMKIQNLQTKIELSNNPYNNILNLIYYYINKNCILYYTYTRFIKILIVLQFAL